MTTFDPTQVNFCKTSSQQPQQHQPLPDAPKRPRKKKCPLRYALVPQANGPLRCVTLTTARSMHKEHANEWMYQRVYVKLVYPGADIRGANGVVVDSKCGSLAPRSEVPQLFLSWLTVWIPAANKLVQIHADPFLLKINSNLIDPVERACLKCYFAGDAKYKAGTYSSHVLVLNRPRDRSQLVPIFNLDTMKGDHVKASLLY